MIKTAIFCFDFFFHFLLSIILLGIYNNASSKKNRVVEIERGGGRGWGGGGVGVL